MTDNAETFLFPLAGREIEVKQVTPGQVIILQRLTLQSQKQARDSQDPKVSANAMSNVIDKTLRVIESLVLNGQDWEWIEEQLLEGVIDHSDLLPILGGKPAEPKKKAVAKRTPKAAPAKAATSRGRAKR